MISTNSHTKGQYHWVSEFAPPAYQKILSYLSGWLSMLGWQAFVAADTFVCAELVMGLAILNNPDFSPTRWQVTLLIIGLVTLFGAFNIFGAKRLALFEAVFAMLHFGVFFAVLITVVVMSPKTSAADVFLNFTDNGANWPNLGLTVLVGQVTAMFTVLGTLFSALIADEIYSPILRL